MAARNRLRLTEEHRKKIQTSMLIKRLSDHAVGKVKMSNTQVRAVEVLLRKTLPDLSAVEMDANHDHRVVVGDKPMSAEEWAAKHAQDASGSGQST